MRLSFFATVLWLLVFAFKIEPSCAWVAATVPGKSSRTVQRTVSTRLLASNENNENIQDDNSDAIQDDDDGGGGGDDGFNNAKWKKKRFMMMDDVHSRIKRGDRNAPKKAQAMVDRMIYMYETTRQHQYKPTVRAYNLWINALAKSQQRNAGQAAEDVLREMKDNDVQPNIVSYTSVIDAYGKTSSSKNLNAQHAERILFELLERQLVDPSIRISSVTCDAVLNAWAQHGTFEAAERAQSILERLDHLQNEDIKPTTYSYSTVIKGWAKCRDGEAAQRAQDVLDRMLSEDQVEPDTIVFNSVIHAWANSGDARAGIQATKLLNQMQEVHDKAGYPTEPDIITYNTVVAAWSQSGQDNSAQQAEKVLKQMQKAWSLRGKSSGKKLPPEPNTVSYNTVLDAWSKSSSSKAAPRAQKVLDFMIASSKSGKQRKIAPDIISFVCVLNAWAKSKDPDKAVRARDLLDQMLDLWNQTKQKSLQPTVIPFNTVLNACAFSSMGTTTKQQKKAMQVAVNTFKQLSNMPSHLNLGPDSLTFGNMIKCCANLIPQGAPVRDEMATQLFTKCCKEGMVGDLVWNEMQRAVSPLVLSQVLESQNAPESLLSTPIGTLDVRDLPKSWWKKTIGRKAGPAVRKKETKQEAKPARPIRRMISTTEASWNSSQM